MTHNSAIKFATGLILLLVSYSSLSFAQSDEMLVSPESLLKQIDNPKLVILDARTLDEYNTGHIKGAVSLPVSDTYNPNPPTDRLAPQSHITPLFSNAGIDADSIVVVYDNGVFKSAARVIWALWVYGHDNAAILTINYKGWENKDYPISTLKTTPAPKTFISHLMPSQVATQLHTQLAISDSNSSLVDVRTVQEYRGEISKSRRFGHIPSAISYDWRHMSYQEDGAIKLKSRDELEQLFSSLSRENKVITYCNKGQEAALGNFVLKLLDYDVSLYDGGWHEWGNSPDLPVEGPDDKPAIPATDK